MQTISINKSVLEVNFETYKQSVIHKNKIQHKRLKPQQIRFLTYPFITSVFWAKQRGKKVAKKNVHLYYQTKHKQLALRFS